MDMNMNDEGHTLGYGLFIPLDNMKKKKKKKKKKYDIGKL
jgi:hypothetical protein